MDLAALWHALAASGPTAIVLGFACIQLWRSNQAERERHLARETQDRADFLVALRQEQDRHQKEEGEIRAEYISTLKSIAARVNGEPHA